MKNLFLVFSIIFLILFSNYFEFTNAQYIGEIGKVQTNSLEKCVVGNYGGFVGLGSWSISVEKEESGICYLDYNYEIEGGYNDYKCKIPVNEIKTTERNDLELDYLPIESELINQYCTKIKSDNIFDDFLISGMLIMLGTIIFVSLMIYFATWAVVKKLLHKKHPKLIGVIVVAVFFFILFILSYAVQSSYFR